MYGQGDRKLSPPPPYTATKFASTAAAFGSWAVAHGPSTASASASCPPLSAWQSGLTAVGQPDTAACLGPQLQPAAAVDGRSAPVQLQHQRFRRPALDWPIGLSGYYGSSSSQSYGQIINFTAAAAAAAAVNSSLGEVPCALLFDNRNASWYQQQYQQYDQYQHHFQNHQNQDFVFSHVDYHHSQPMLVPSTGNLSWEACLICGGATYYTSSPPLLSSISPDEAHILEVNYNRRRFREQMQDNMKLAMNAMLQGRMTFLQAIVNYGLPRGALRKKANLLLQPRQNQSQITPPELLNLLTAMADSEKRRPRGRGAYRKYEQKTLEEAAAAVLRGDMSVLHAGFHYNVPSSTVGNLVRVMKRQQRDGWSRPRGSADDTDQQDAPSPPQSFGQPRQESSNEQPAEYPLQ